MYSRILAVDIIREFLAFLYFLQVDTGSESFTICSRDSTDSFYPDVNLQKLSTLHYIILDYKLRMNQDCVIKVSALSYSLVQWGQGTHV